MNILGPKGVAAFEGRKINHETAVTLGIYTARSDGDRVVPDENGNIIAFPFMYRNQLLNEKYRAPGKKFWQWKQGKQVFWNADVLDDPALETGAQPLVITEGELDALSAIDSGWPLTVSVPSGAPPVRFGEVGATPMALDPENEPTGKFGFVWFHRERLKHIKRFIIAVDNDPPGELLATELVRRLSPSRCYRPEYPPGCKDLNDILQQHGPMAVTAALNSAKPYPVRGLYRLSDYPANARALEVFSTGWPILDTLMKPYHGEFMVVTGIPGHGKSSFMMHLLCNLARLHEWRAAVFSPEMPTVPHLRNKMRRLLASDTSDPDAFIDYFFRFIGSDPTGEDDEDFDLDWVIDKATEAVMRDDIRVLLIDPWNEVEHAREPRESMTDYIGRGIRALKRFARLYGVTVIVVTHPTKEVGKDGKSRTPTLYDIDGSAHWFNKCDHGLVIDRASDATNEVAIHVKKVRFEESGEKGKVTMRYDRMTCRFEPLVPDAGRDEMF